MDAAMRTVVRFCFLGALLCVATWIEGVQTQSGLGINISFEQTTYFVEEGLEIEVCVVINGTLSREAIVTLFSSNNEAQAMDDYTAISENLTFSETETRICSYVISVEDDTLEEDEEFTLTLSTDDPSIVLGPSEATVTILDNDTVTIGFEQPVYTTTEGSDASVEVCASVRDGTLERAVIVTFFTTDDNATSVDPADYTAVSVELMFTTGTTRNCQDIPIENDDILESTEFFFANLNTSDPDVSLEPNVSEISVSEDPNDEYILQVDLKNNPHLGQSVELYCGFKYSPTLMSYSTLQWLDGELPIQNSSSRELHADGLCGLTLRIHNFSILDYGRYQCRCFNSYNLYDIYNEGTIEPFCSEPSKSIELPPNDSLTIESVNVSDAETLALEQYCNQTNTITWTKVGQLTPEEWMSENVTVSKPEDRGKFVCHDGNDTVHSIVYVSIKDYLPLRMLQISPGETTLFLPKPIISDRRAYGPICATFPPTADSTLHLFVFYANDTQKEVNTAFNVPTFIDDVTIYAHNLTDRGIPRIQINVESPLNDTEINKFFQRQFRCVVISRWEQLSVNFTINITSEAVIGQSANASTCPVTSSSQPILNTTLQTQQSTSTSAPSSIPTSSMSMTVAAQQPGSLSPAAIAATVSVVLVTTMLVIVIVSLCILLWRKHINDRKMILGRDSDGNGRQDSARHPFARLSLSLAEEDLNLPTPIADSRFPVSRPMATCIQDLRQSQWSFPFEKLHFECELGSGAFGVVKKACALSPDPSQPSTTVAVKMLKDLASDEDEKDIISEMRVLQHVGAHPNVVSLLGASLHEGKLYVIMEYCSGGNLLQYLRSKRGDKKDPLSTRRLIKMASQVATGMEFLAAKNCIHRDLAARNILIAEGFVLKVADFGLARKMYNSVYRPTGGKLPLKWMAPESIIDRVYTTQSDVWSFGVLLWEIMTLGRSPYPGMSVEKILKDIESGYRMSRPDKCPQDVYDIIMKCWQWSPSTRPSFTDLRSILEETAMRGTFTDHYYNMVDELGIGTDVDSIESGSYTLCSYCKESTNTSSGIFCSHCSQNGYTQFQGTKEGKRGHDWLDNSDSGIRIPDGSICDNDGNTYLRVISGSQGSIPADLVDDISQCSLCSYCRAEEVLQSTFSLCSNCRALENPSTEGVENTQHSTPDGVPQTGSNSAYYNLGRRKLIPKGPQLDHQGEPSSHKRRLEPLDSYDSGIKMDSEGTWEERTLNDVDFSPRSELAYHESGATSMQLEGSATTQKLTRHRLSAHPKNRLLFEQLGFSESDV